MRPLRLSAGVGAASIVLLALPLSSAQAANSIEISGTAEATGSAGTSIVSGDTFAFSYSLDLDSVETGTAASGNTFNNAVTSFTMSAGAGNTGTWSPSGVNWLISPVHNLVTNQNSDSLTLQVQATNAPAINGEAFLDVGITLLWNQTDVDIQQVPNGDNLGDALGTLSPDVGAASFFFEMRDTSFQSAPFVATATPAAGPASQETAGAPPPVLQQFGKEQGASCDTIAPASVNIGGAPAGGWGESWAQWMNNGLGGPVCTRTLFYSNSRGKWIID